MKGHPANCIHSSPINFGGRFLDGTTPLSQEGQEVSNFFGQSSFGSYAIAKEGNVVKVDKDVDIALLGPLGCGIQTGSGTVLNRLRPEFGSSLVVYGAGAVGLSAVMAAKLVGYLNIIVVDIHDNRLELAKDWELLILLTVKEMISLKLLRTLLPSVQNMELILQVCRLLSDLPCEP